MLELVMGLTMIPMVVFGVELFALIVWAISRSSRNETSGYTGSKRNSLDITKEHYARGEITKEQFEQIKKDLTSLSL